MGKVTIFLDRKSVFFNFRFEYFFKYFCLCKGGTKCADTGIRFYS